MFETLIYGFESELAVPVTRNLALCTHEVFVFQQASHQQGGRAATEELRGLRHGGREVQVLRL